MTCRHQPLPLLSIILYADFHCRNTKHYVLLRIICCVLVLHHSLASSLGSLRQRRLSPGSGHAGHHVMTVPSLQEEGLRAQQHLPLPGERPVADILASAFAPLGMSCDQHLCRLHVLAWSPLSCSEVIMIVLRVCLTEMDHLAMSS